MKSYDAVVVGARCAGSTLAGRLAQAGWRTLIVERHHFPRDTLSTHFLFPNTVAQLHELGALDRMRADHEVPLVRYRVKVLGREIDARFSRVGGFDRGIAPRRLILDSALLAVARDAGAEVQHGVPVTGLIGSGTDADPVTGVELADGRRIRARWVFGADGRASTVARSLRVPKEQERRAKVCMMLAYWCGLPDVDVAQLDQRADRVLNWIPCEDGIGLLAVTLDPACGRGGPGAREAAYTAALRTFPETLDPNALRRASRIGEPRLAPESMLRGYFREPAGPGWALLGDAAHFKHPATAQGIGDAIDQATWVADALTGGPGELTGYRRWRDESAAEHYAFSYQFARFPTERTARMFGGIASDAAASRDFADALCRLKAPSDVFTAERLANWLSRAKLEPVL